MLSSNTLTYPAQKTAKEGYWAIQVRVPPLMVLTPIDIGFASSFTPSTADSWQLMSGGGDYTGFNTISTPDGWSLTSTGMLVAVVPEPASLLLALSGLTLAGGYLRRSRRPAASADQTEKIVPPSS